MVRIGGKTRVLITLQILVLCGGLASREGHCAVSAISLESGLSNLSTFLTGDIASAEVKTIGLTFDHRAYEPATPLGNRIGFDLGLEATVVQVPPLLTDALAVGGFSVPLTFLPSVKVLNFHKGITDMFDVGGSIFTFRGYLIWAVDLKMILLHPEEGATWAIRLSRNSTHLPVGTTTLFMSELSLDIDTVTWTPQLIVSKKMSFADPYLGIGYQYATGGMYLTTLSGPTIPGLESITSAGGSFMGFLGLSLAPPSGGLRLTLELAYSAIGFNSMGTKFGFTF